MSIITSLRFILRHPLNADRRINAIRSFLLWQIGSRIVPGPVIVPFINGSVLAVARGMSSATGNIYCGLYGFEEMGFLLHVLREGHLFVDVGANVGTYTVLAGAAAGARCISIEPVPSTFIDLRRNIQLNGLGSLCEVHNIAAAGKDGTLLFTNNEGATNHVVISNGVPRADTISVPVGTLDGIVGEREPTILKIDAEGFETEVLAGASGILANPSLLGLIIQLNGRGRQYGYDEEAIHRKILVCGLTPYRYDPFARKLSQAAGKNNVGRYTLYCRGADRIRRLVSSAPKYRIRDREL
jgi:FkbM family methyltransferase